MDEAMIEDLNSLIQLDTDAVYCYGEAINRIDDRDVASTLETFRGDHVRHIDELSTLVRTYGGEPPERTPDLRGRLLQGITALRSATGTEGALKAMEMNEKKTNEEYEQAQDWAVPADVRAVLARGLDDERRHLEYVQSELHALA